MDTIEHTLYICREVNVFRIPPRPAAGGHKSGDWKVADKIFTGRLRAVAIGDACELRLEDANSGELFGTCPVAQGQRPVAVEPVSDSSRYFVLRLLDKASGRHAFVGLGFTDRGEAFDFNVALSDHEKQAHRASQAADSSDSGSGPSWASKEIAALDTGKDFSLKQGETIRVNMKKASPSGGGAGFLSGLGGTGLSRNSPAAFPAPPPAASTARISPRSAQPSAPSYQQQPSLQQGWQPQYQQHQQQQAPAQQQQGHQPAQPVQDPFSVDLLGLSSPAPAPQTQKAVPQPQANKAPDSWATF